MSESPDQSAVARQDFFRFLVLLGMLIFLYFAGSFFKVDYILLEGFLKGISPGLSGFLFIVLYVGVTFFVWLAKDVFKLIGALLFGPYYSTLLIVLAEFINCALLFYLARFFGKDFIERSWRIGSKNLNDKVAKISFFWLFLFRFTPLIPFRFLDLSAGLTGLSFKKYFAAVALGSPVRIFWVQFVLAGVGTGFTGNPQAIAEYLLAHKALLGFSFFYVILVIAVGLKLKYKE